MFSIRFHFWFLQPFTLLFLLSPFVDACVANKQFDEWTLFYMVLRLDSCLYILYECSIALFARWNNSQIENCAQFHNSGKWKVNLYAKYERISFSAPCSGPGDQMSINLRRNVNPFFPPNQLNSVILLYHYIVSMHSHYILFQINQRNNDFLRAFLVKCIFNAKGDFFFV